MKTRKLLAILVAVAMIVTMLPVVAFADEDLTPNRFQSDFEANRDSQVTSSDGSKYIKFTVYTLNAAGIPVPAKVYFASSRGNTDTFDGDGVARIAENDEIWYVNTGEDGEAEVEVWSSVPGTAKIGFALRSEEPDEGVTLYEYLTGESANTALLELIGTKEVEFTAASTSGIEVRKVTDADGTEVDEDEVVENKYAGNVRGNGLDYYEVSFGVVAGDTPARGKEVTFSANKPEVRFNKTSATTNVAGIAKVKVYAEKPGTYKVKASAGSKNVELSLKFVAGAIADISLESGGNGEITAAENDYSFKLKLLDINGNKVSVSSDVNAVDLDGLQRAGYSTLDFEVVTEPDDSDIDVDSDLTFGEDDGLLKVTVVGSALEEEGNYNLRAKLDNGRYVDVKFEVKEQGDIVRVELSYDQNTLALGAKSSKATLKRFDANGVFSKADVASDVTFILSDYRKATVDSDGVITATDDSKYAGTLVITAIDEEYDLTDTFEMKIGAEPISFEAKVESEALVGEDVKVGIQFYDASGDPVALGTQANAELSRYYVIAKPSGAFVTVDESSKFADELAKAGYSYVEINSDKAGLVKVQLVITADVWDADAGDAGDGDYVPRQFTGVVELNVGEPKPEVDKGAGKVVLTIGGTFGFVDGAVTSLDAPAFIEAGRTFVPVRFLAEAFGAEADWEPKDAPVETVTLTREDMEIIINIGEEVLTVVKDGEEEVVTFDGAARIVDGRTYLPFRAIAEAFGAEVDYGPQDGPVEWVSFEQ